MALSRYFFRCDLGLLFDTLRSHTCRPYSSDPDPIISLTRKPFSPDPGRNACRVGLVWPRWPGAVLGLLIGCSGPGRWLAQVWGPSFPCLEKQNAANWPTPSPLEGHLWLHIPPSTKQQLQTKWQQQPPPQASCLDGHDDQFKASDGLPIGPTSWVLSLSALWPDCQSADVSPLLILLDSPI